MQRIKHFYRKLTFSNWIGIGFCFLFIISALPYGMGVLLITLGFIFLGTACYKIVSNRNSWLNIANRNIAIFLAIGSIVTIFVGSFLAP